VHDLSHAEIARRLVRTENAMQKPFHRAMERTRLRLIATAVPA
jgi:hypothetical protein